MTTTLPPSYTFDDVLLVPHASSVNPSDANVSTVISPHLSLTIPILAAAMDTVSEPRLAVSLSRLGGLAVLHRNCTVARQVSMVRAVVKAGERVAAACGPHDIARAQALDKAGAVGIVIDCAHAHRPDIKQTAHLIKKTLIHADLIIGNIVTAAAARFFSDVADALKVGIGPGSICTTRVVAGVGVPQFTAITEVARIARQKHIRIIADGGIKHSGDIVKALAAGADAVMIGSLFAATEEAPGKKIKIKGVWHKAYRGMGSLGVMENRKSTDRYFQKGAAKFVPEGVEGAVPLKGTLAETTFQLVGGLKSGMGYLGAKTLNDLRRHARFTLITKAGLFESHPHSITMTKQAPNY